MTVNRLSNQSIVGIIIVAIGIIFLVDSLGLMETGSVFRWWPSLIILAGVWRLVANRFAYLFGPLLMISIGVFIQLLMLGLDIGGLWPVILIILGVLLFVGGPRLRKLGRGRREHRDDVNALGVFSRADVKSQSKTFQGGQTTALMGSAVLDLTNTEIENRPAILEATAIFGSVEIRVPSQWVVRNDALAFFGGNEDKRQHAGTSDDSEPDLVIKGLAMFGSIEVKD